MTKDEYQRWIAETTSARGTWKLDQIHSTKENFLAYKLVEDYDGFFISINKGRIHIGAFRGAIPHIGEALFHTHGAWNVNAREDRERLIERAILQVAGEAIHQVMYPSTHELA